MFKPLHDVVYIRPSDANTMAGSLIISHEKPTLMGEVVYIGSGSEAYPYPDPQVKLGDVVAYHRAAHEKVNVQGEDLVMLHEKDLLGIYGQ